MVDDPYDNMNYEMYNNCYNESSKNNEYVESIWKFQHY